MAFAIYEELKYTSKPDLSALATNLTIVSESQILPDPNVEPTQPQVDSRLAAYVAHTGLLCIDIESWWDNTNQSTRLAAAGKYLRLFQKMAITCPLATIGYYGTIPIRDYSNAIDGDGTPTYDAWQLTNDDYQSVASVVHITFPSCYTFHPKPAQHALYMKAQIDECRRLAPTVPCYPFTWSQYHDSVDGMAYQWMNYNFYYQQLLLARKYADGVVIWGKSGYLWADFALTGAWLAVQDFCASDPVLARIGA